MLDYFYEISTVRLAIYCAVFFIGLMWLGILFLKPILRLLIGRQPGINDLVFHTTAGFSLFYGLLLGLLTVAAYQNLEEVRQNVFDEASNLASLYRDASYYPEPLGSQMRELLEDYTLYVIYKDWPAHCQGIIYHGGTNRLSIIEYSILNCNPEDESQQIIQVRHFRNLGSSSRRDSGVCPAPGCRSRESCGMS